MGNRDPRIRHTLATVVCVAILAWGALPARSASTPTTHPTGAGRAAAGAGRVASPPAPSTGEAGVRGRRPRRRHRRRRRPRRRTRFDARVRLGGYYDSNVFDYSDADRATFEGATAPLPRFPISSLGDYVTTVAARADWTRRTARRTAWRLRLRYDGRLHVRNGERDRHGFGLELRRRGRHSETTLSTSLTPRIYLRHLYARSQAAYAPAERGGACSPASRDATTTRRSTSATTTPGARGRVWNARWGAACAWTPRWRCRGRVRRAPARPTRWRPL